MSPYSSSSRSAWGPIVIVAAMVIFVAFICASVVHWPCPPFCSTPTPTASPVTGTPSATPDTPVPPPTNTVLITMFSSDTKEDWLDEVIASFNAARFQTGLGNTIFVTVEHGNSGDPVEWIPAGTLKPTIWSPGEYSWVLKLNQIWEELHGRPLTTQECRPTVYAPVGFAMFRPMAEAMGWPDKPIGWDEIIALAADPEGWARYDNPQWGQFKFGHTHPDHSNSGLLLLTALAYSVFDRQDGLSVQLVKSAPYVDAMRTIELHTYHYGIKSRDNIVRMIQKGPAFLHATNTSEAETLRANSGIYGEPQFPLVFIFPAEGTFWAEQPFCVLENAAWVSAEQAEAAWMFYDYLLDPAQQALTVQNYLRPVDPTIPLTVTLENGTDPGVTPQTVPALASVSPEVSGAVQDVFHQTKKKLTVVLVLDTSGSMQEGNKIAAAGEAAATLAEALESDDAIYTYLFSSSVVELPPSGRAGDVKEELARKLKTVVAEGNTALYDAVCLAAQRVAALRADDLAAGEARLYGIVVLSDGEDTDSVLYTENDVGSLCLPAGEDVQGVRVFTIAYVTASDQTACSPGDVAGDFLIRLANRTDGKCYSADPENINEVLPGILVQ